MTKNRVTKKLARLTFRGPLHFFLVVSGVSLMALILSGCLDTSTSDEVDADAGTRAEIVPRLEAVVCNPFGNDDFVPEPKQGIKAQLKYLNPDQPQYTDVADYIQFGQSVSEIDIFFNQLNVPTRPFDRGYVTQSGQTIQTAQGDTLYEWFSLEFKGRLKLGSTQSPGNYQLALLSDDGAIWQVDDGMTGLVPFVDNDHFHSTRFACAQNPLNLQAGELKNFALDYFQGPRFHIALVAMWRPWPADGDVNDPLCGVSGNSTFFDYNQSPPTPKPAYDQLLSRGWRPLTPENFVLPNEVPTNPCNQPEPQISQVSITLVEQAAVTLSWQTDVAATSQVEATDAGSGEVILGPWDLDLVTDHQYRLTGLQANRLYNVKVISTSASGLTTESDILSFQTKR